MPTISEIEIELNDTIDIDASNEILSEIKRLIIEFVRFQQLQDQFEELMGPLFKNHRAFQAALLIEEDIRFEELVQTIHSLLPDASENEDLVKSKVGKFGPKRELELGPPIQYKK